jgi:hypothetical protein
MKEPTQLEHASKVTSFDSLYRASVIAIILSCTLVLTICYSDVWFAKVCCWV